jgi:predicted Zn finger-like uncharacterized protein
MIVVCTNCSARLQVNEDEAPAGPFNVRCPKCNTSISSGPRNVTTDAGAVVPDSAALTEQPSPALAAPNAATASFDAASVETNARANTSSVEELGRLLAALLDSNKKGDASNSRPSWNPRRALVCTAEAHREIVSQQLTENNYQVFVAQNTREAVERIRDSQLDVVLLDSEFDAAEQGAAFITREVNILRPPQRRRLFFVLLSPALRTMESHAAFLQNVNAIVNFKDLSDLPRILEHTFREYNELYREFNAALKLHPL